MASLRKLKKAVNSLADQLIGECDNYKRYHPDFDTAKLAELKEEIESKRKAIVDEINKPVEGDKSKVRFEKVIGEFQNTMIPILDKLVK